MTAIDRPRDRTGVPGDAGSDVIVRVGVDLIEGYGLGWHLGDATLRLLFAGVATGTPDQLGHLKEARSVLRRLLGCWDQIPATHGRRRFGFGVKSIFTVCGKLGIVSGPIAAVLFDVVDAAPRRSDIAVAVDKLDAEIARLEMAVQP